MTKPKEEETNTLYQIIGFMTVTWSLLERGLDKIALTIYKGCEGHTIKRNVPQPLKDKLKYIEDSFNKLPVLSAFQKEGLEIVKRTRDLSTKRHTLIHGTISSLYPENNTYVFTKYNFHKHGVRLEATSFAPGDFQRVSEDCRKLAENTAHFSVKLIGKFLKQQ